MLGLSNGLLANNILCEYTRGNCDWTPASISSLTHWYRRGVDQLTTTLLGNPHVYEWQDTEGTNDLTTTPASNTAPQSVENGALFFDTSGHTMIFDSELSLGKFSIYIKCKFDAFANEILMEKGTTDMFQISSSTEVRVKVKNGGAEASRHDYTLPATLAVDTPFNIGWEREDTAATTDDVMRIYLNGVAATQSGTGDGTQVITELLSLTTLGVPVHDSVWYEVVICNDSLSADDRADLNTWLNNV